MISVLVISGAKSSGKTYKIKELINDDKNSLGFYSEKVFVSDKLIGYDLVYNGKRLPLVRDKNYCDFESDTINKRYAFNDKAYNQVFETIKKSKKQNIYIDEIGLLELSTEKGFNKSLEYILSSGSTQKLVISVRNENLIMLTEYLKKHDVNIEILKLENIAAVLMASGSSVRFGSSDKLLAEIDGKSLIEHMIEKLINADCFCDITVVYADEKINEICSKYWNIKAIKNDNAHLGISESVKTGTKANMNADGIMFVPADQIYISIESLQKLCIAFKESNNSIIRPVYGDEYGSPVIFPKTTFDELLKLEGDIGGRNVIKNNIDIVKEVILKNEEKSDIDTKYDLEEYRHRRK